MGIREHWTHTLQHPPQGLARSTVVSNVLFASLFIVSLAATPNPSAGVSITPNPIVFNIATCCEDLISGSLSLVGTTAGVPPDGLVLDGAVDANDLSLIFQLSLDPSSPLAADSLRIQIAGSDPFNQPDPDGVGWIPGALVDVQSGELEPSGSQVVRFDFNLGPGEATDSFFVSYSSGELRAGDPVYSLIHPVTAVQYFFLPGAFLVPEPNLTSLLLVGVVMLAVRSWTFGAASRADGGERGRRPGRRPFET